MFSYFVTRRPTGSEIKDAEFDVFLFTRDSLFRDNHNDVYAGNEELDLEWQGNMIERKNKRKNIVDKEAAISVNEVFKPVIYTEFF